MHVVSPNQTTEAPKEGTWPRFRRPAEAEIRCSSSAWRCSSHDRSGLTFIVRAWHERIEDFFRWELLPRPYASSKDRLMLTLAHFHGRNIKLLNVFFFWHVRRLVFAIYTSVLP